MNIRIAVADRNYEYANKIFEILAEDSRFSVSLFSITFPSFYNKYLFSLSYSPDQTAAYRSFSGSCMLDRSL